MNRIVENVLFASIGFVLGATLISKVEFKVKHSPLQYYVTKCNGEVDYYYSDFKGNILYAKCIDETKVVK